MNFSDLMAKEISKKKAKAESIAGNQKVISRQEIEKERQADYLRQQQNLEQERLARRKRLEEAENAEKDRERKRKQRIIEKEKELEKAHALGSKESSEPADPTEDKGSDDDTEDQPDDYILEDLDDESRVYQQIKLYISSLLHEWRSIAGSGDDKQAGDILIQAQKDIAPLMDLLTRKALNPQMYISLCTVFMHLQRREYREASEAYMKLSIGNVAWPIGVTAVGLHARSAEEKITGATEVANIMKDETTRKWLTSVKRLITFVENNGLS